MLPRIGVLAALLLSLAMSAQAATITIVNNDDPGEGFNDPTGVAPIGGNPGTTLGAQRLNVFQYAANIWGDRLSSNVEIIVNATFDPLECTQFGAVLGAAGPSTLIRDFGAGTPATWYPPALANELAGTDLIPAFPDIVAIFSSVVDNQSCLGNRDFYYGLDGNTTFDLDLASVVIHELGHGLGFTSAVTLSTGAQPNGFDDVYSNNLENHATGKLYPNMSNGERVTASTATGNLHWVGSNVVDFVGSLAASTTGSYLSTLSDGFDPVSGHMEMYAPGVQEPGSSVSHWSNDVTPSDIMEPFLSTPNHNLELTLKLMADLGWSGIIQCGDADRNGARNATDALIALRTSVGASSCRESLCDPSADGRVSATDALIMLKGAVGQSVVYDCGLT